MLEDYEEKYFIVPKELGWLGVTKAVDQREGFRKSQRLQARPHRWPQELAVCTLRIAETNFTESKDLS